MPKDYLAQLLANMQAQLTRIEGKTDEQTNELAEIRIQTQATNGRVNAHDDRLKLIEKSIGKKTSLKIEPGTMYLIALGFAVVLIIVASLLRVNLKGLL